MSSANEVDSVLAHLVFSHGVGLKPEDATTEAVVYVLNRSEAVRRRLHEFVNSMTGLQLASVERYETQVQQGEKQRPDIVGYSATNQQVLLIENKFWADLTANQPVAYLSVLESGEPGLVLFVCPSTRLDLLWKYLLDRVHGAGLVDGMTVDSTQSSDPRRILLQGGNHALGCISWSRILLVLQQAAQDAYDMPTVGNLKQISGLVAQVDVDNPFLPLRDGDLVQSQGRIFLSLKDIDKKLRLRIVSSGVQYYQKRSDNTWIYCKEGKIQWFDICLNIEMWARWGCSPFWVVIGVWDNNPNYSALRSAVSEWLDEGPHRAVESGTQSRRSISVPVIPPLGVERDVVVSQLAEMVINKITDIEQRLSIALDS